MAISCSSLPCLTGSYFCYDNPAALQTQVMQVCFQRDSCDCHDAQCILLEIVIFEIYEVWRSDSMSHIVTFNHIDSFYEEKTVRCSWDVVCDLLFSLCVLGYESEHGVVHAVVRVVLVAQCGAVFSRWISAGQGLWHQVSPSHVHPLMRCHFTAITHTGVLFILARLGTIIFSLFVLIGQVSYRTHTCVVFCCWFVCKCCDYIFSDHICCRCIG